MNFIFFSFFFIFGSWLLPEKFSVCPKNNGFGRLRGLEPHPPVSTAARTPMPLTHCLLRWLLEKQVHVLETFTGLTVPWWLQASCYSQSPGCVLFCCNSCESSTDIASPPRCTPALTNTHTIRKTAAPLTGITAGIPMGITVRMRWKRSLRPESPRWFFGYNQSDNGCLVSGTPPQKR